MPTYEIFIEGKPRRVELTKTGENAFTVKMDNKSMNVELLAEKPDFEEAFSIKVDGKTYQIELPRIDRQKTFQAKVEEATFKAEVKKPTRGTEFTVFKSAPLTPMKKAIVTKQVAEEGVVTAPMTGRILSVKVKKGDPVKAGQILCILEAMKMENEISSPKAGTIREVYVSDGSSVSEGESLFTID